MELKSGAKVLIINGDGINCDYDLEWAFKKHGALVTLTTLSEIIKTPSMIHSYHILGFPGGFSFGDELKSGVIYSQILKEKVLPDLKKFNDEKKLIIGICNGFQILMELNAFHDFKENRTLALSENSHEKFLNYWTKFQISPSNSPWLKGIAGDLFLPLRNREGRLVGKIDKEQIVLRFSEDENGSLDRGAGVINRGGNIFGLMPHPEAALIDELAPYGIPNDNYEIVNKIFSNSIEYCHHHF